LHSRYSCNATLMMMMMMMMMMMTTTTTTTTMTKVIDTCWYIFAATLRIGGHSTIHNLRMHHSNVTGTN
jgi:hypothetical protein